MPPSPTKQRSGSSDDTAAANNPTLATFGIVLTGRLGLRNDLLSTFSGGKDFWDERYFVLTRKGLHYYVRQRDSDDTHRRDLFGEHEGSLALGNIAHIDLGDEEQQKELTFVVASKGGGRKYIVRAGTSELYQRWVTTLQAAVSPAEKASSSGQQASGGSSQACVRSNSGTHHVSSSQALCGGAGMRSSSSFARIPTLLDFRCPPRTDNLAYVTLHSTALGLDLFLESGLPWGVQTLLERDRHQISCAVARRGDHVFDAESRDVLQLVLEGGATASIPLSRTLLRRPRGSAIVPLQAPTLHKAIRLSWEACAAPQHAPQPPPTSRRLWASAVLRQGWRSGAGSEPGHQTAAAVAAAALFLLHLTQSAVELEATATPTEGHAGGSHASGGGGGGGSSLSLAGSLSLFLGSCLSSLPLACLVQPLVQPLLRPLLALVAAGGCLLALGVPLGSHGRWLAVKLADRRTPLRVLRRLPAALVGRVPRRLRAAIGAAAQPDAWRFTLEPASLEEARAGPASQRSGRADASQALLAPMSPAHSAAPADSELQVDALFADVASDEHSILYHGAVALRAAHQKALPLMSRKLPEAYPANSTAAAADGSSQLDPTAAVAAAVAAAAAADVATAPAAAAAAAPSADACATAATAATAAAGVPAAEDAAAAAPTLELPDLELESFLHAFDCAVIQVLSALGPAMLILVKNDQVSASECFGMLALECLGLLRIAPGRL